MILNKNTLITRFLILVIIIFSIVLVVNSSNVIYVESKSITVIDKPTIVIDAGHGGEDGGAVTTDNTLEKDLNLEISLILSDMLKSSGFDVILTRDTDISLFESGNSIRERKISDTYNRLSIYDSSENNIIVSIHQNKFEESKYSGTQIFYGTQNKNSALLANSIKNSVVGMMQPTNTRENKEATNDVFLLSKTKNPAVIVECGFLSNENELKLLKSSEYQKEISFAIMCGILDYYYKTEC